MWQLGRVALGHAEALELSSLERLETERDLRSHGLQLACAALSVGLTFVVRGRHDPWVAAPGSAYWLLVPAMVWHHRRFGALRQALPQVPSAD